MGSAKNDNRMTEPPRRPNKEMTSYMNIELPLSVDTKNCTLPWCDQSARDHHSSIATGWCWLDTVQCPHFWWTQCHRYKIHRHAMCRHCACTDTSHHSSCRLAPPHGSAPRTHSGQDCMTTTQLLLRWLLVWPICSNLMKLMKNQNIENEQPTTAATTAVLAICPMGAMEDIVWTEINVN